MDPGFIELTDPQPIEQSDLEGGGSRCFLIRIPKAIPSLKDALHGRKIKMNSDTVTIGSKHFNLIVDTDPSSLSITERLRPLVNSNLLQRTMVGSKFDGILSLEQSFKEVLTEDEEVQEIPVSISDDRCITMLLLLLLLLSFDVVFTVVNFDVVLIEFLLPRINSSFTATCNR